MKHKTKDIGTLKCLLHGMHASLIHSRNVTLLSKYLHCHTAEKTDVPHLPLK